MTTNKDKVDVLQKITLIPESGSGVDELASYSYEFIFGIGPEGLTPFEYDLAGKKCGDAVRISIRKDIIAEYFGHISPPLLLFSKDEGILHLNMKIERIEKALPSELVRAMAAMAGGCSCGCGGHGHKSADCDPSGCNAHGNSVCGCAH